jgi:Tfp pilus assembly protein PilX
VKTDCSERGIALVLSLWMLVILGLLGAIVLAASTVEMRLAANDRNAQTALFTADAALQYAKYDPAIYTTIGPGTGGSPAGTVTQATLPIGGNTAQNVSVTYLTVAPPPVGSGFDADLYNAQYFQVQATGVGPNNSQVLIESQVAKPVPK